MADIVGCHKSFKMNVPIDDIRHYGELLHQTFNNKLDNCRSMYRYVLQFYENNANDFETQITETIKYAEKHNFQTGITRDVALESINKWLNAVAKQDKEAVLSLYCDDATLWPTLSNVLRQTNDEISDYFDLFLQKIDGDVELNQFVYQPLDDNNCLCSGVYTFSLKEGQARARFTYSLKKVDSDWKILHHHSSLMPE